MSLKIKFFNAIKEYKLNNELTSFSSEEVITVLVSLISEKNSVNELKLLNNILELYKKQIKKNDSPLFEKAISVANFNVLDLLFSKDYLDPMISSGKLIKFYLEQNDDNLFLQFISQKKIDIFHDKEEPLYLLYDVIEKRLTKSLNYILNRSELTTKNIPNQSLVVAYTNNHFDILESLLKDDRFNPLELDCLLPCLALGNKEESVLIMLMNHKIVKKELPKKNLELFNAISKIVSSKKIKDF